MLPKCPRLLPVLAVVAAASIGAGRLRAQSAASAPQLELQRIEAAGIRVLEGRHLLLLTDLSASLAVDELPAVFDAAVPLWAEYFGVPAQRVASQRWIACLIDDRERFAAAGLLPEDNPNFINGYARDGRLWLVEQPSDYYRRHLLLHEGTHAFMQSLLGGAGPGWYMEGMAELLGTHRWQDGRLELGVIPASRDEVPMWGRTKIIRDAVAAGKPWPLERVLAVDNSRALDVDHYAWTWALAALLDGHPQHRERFRELSGHAADPNFTQRFREAFADDWDELLIEWSAYVPQLDYGYDVQRMAVVYRDPSEPGRLGLGEAQPPRPVTIAANRGWQSTGWQLKAGVEYRLTARGRYQIAQDPDGRPWPCEPGGVTIEYHDGHPLGMLLGALEPGDEAAGSFAKPAAIGLGTTLTPEQDGVLYLRVNDNPAELADSRGELSVEIQTLAPGQ